MMSDYESNALSGPTYLPDAGPHPHSSTPTRSSLCLASCQVPIWTPLSWLSLPHSFHALALLRLHLHRLLSLLESVSGSPLILQPNVAEVAQPPCQFLLPLLVRSPR
ncbi:hypothetical protein CRENBAI_005048 [Crenichthys baileyi]|uniref:Uncharacterized protein n=1 Tax=Crenichthys baileyi TaxID=28760 RepID=A0AAV9SJ55_9TELE